MGATHVTVTMRNPTDPEKSWEGLFLVDSGTIDSLVPKDRLESVGIEIDPRNQKLKRMPATRLKKLKPKI